MEIINDQHSMENVIECLNKWTELYDKGQPAVSDKEWDDLYFQLMQLEKETGLILENSPTQTIKYEIVSELQKVKNDPPLLSLDKTKEISDIEDKFANKAWIAMAKCDGLSCRLIYQNGRLIQAATRGNGEVGEDITHNAKVIRNIPKIIPHSGRLVVDGEIVCLAEDFKSFADEYANSRNFASGSIRLLDSAESAKRKLSFIAWDCIYDDESETNLLSQQLEDLALYGFTIVNYGINEVSVSEAIELLKYSAETEGIPLDGIVFKVDNKSEYYEAGVTGHHPRAAIAYKFYDEEYETELLDIEWSMGRTGVLSPVAIYREIEMEGTMCSRASLHNINTLVEILGEYPYVGQKIKTYKALMINPQVSRGQKAEEVLGADPAYFLNDPEIKFLFPPKECPVCGAPTEKRQSDSGTIELYCSSDTCEGKLVNRLEHFAGKKGLDIKGLSKATFEKLIDWGWVTCLKDLFLLSTYRNEWINKPGFGVKSVDRVLTAIEEARHTTLEQYLSAISIPLIGRTYARELARIFETYEDFRTMVTPDPISEMQPFDFTQLDGFGPEKHDAIMNFDYYEADRMVNMRYIEFKEKDAQLENFGNAHSLQDLIICVTGKLRNFKNRDELKSLIESHGGKMTTSVSSKTSYLVNNDITSTSSKNTTAKSLGIPIITEEELLDMLN